MNKILRIILIAIAILAVAAGLVYAGTLVGRQYVYRPGWRQPGVRMMNAGPGPGREAPGFYGGMMGADGYGHGMRSGRRANGSGMTLASALCSGASAVVGGYGYNNPGVNPLSIDQAYQAAEKYLTGLSNLDLKIAEVMAFDNNAYVRVVEQGTGIGAFELLVDPATQVAFPEHGPNRMWNLKYGGLNHQQMMGGNGGMMGSYTSNVTPDAVPPDMPVSPAQALQVAQEYLDSAMPGTRTAADADPFYGYYTIDLLRDGRTVGMLSVNGFTGQIFVHTWHGTFLESKDY